MPPATEINFDGMVGPTHNYAGLSAGNLASQRHAAAVSHPKAAALQGLAKMKALQDLGLPQAVLPPHPRPRVDVLRSLGFGGSDADVLWRAGRDAPKALAAAYSASAMWAANAATVRPSSDGDDGRVHFTPANLVTQFHRSLEPPTTAAVLRAIFPEGPHFAHHAPLPAADAYADEGAANHLRLGRPGEAGLHVFVYGRAAGEPGPARHPARQTRAAGEAVARLHGLLPERSLLLRQSPAVIDGGAFHNDVVATANGDVLLYHPAAFADGDAVDRLAAAYRGVTGRPLSAHAVDVELADAVTSYLFNSQLVTLPDGTTALLAPAECRENSAVRRVIADLTADGGPVRSVHYLDVRQSMRNGGGPACLRLRVVLTAAERAAAHPGVFLTDDLYTRLVELVSRRYRDDLRPDDLPDPAFAREAADATAEVFGLLGLGSVQS